MSMMGTRQYAECAVVLVRCGEITENRHLRSSPSKAHGMVPTPPVLMPPQRRAASIFDADVPGNPPEIVVAQEDGLGFRGPPGGGGGRAGAQKAPPPAAFRVGPRRGGVLGPGAPRPLSFRPAVGPPVSFPKTPAEYGGPTTATKVASR